MTARAADDDDLMLVAELHSSNRERGRQARRGGNRRRSWVRFLTRRPARTIVGAIAAALLTSIVINALVLQKARHPAPVLLPVHPPKERATTHDHRRFATHAPVPSSGAGHAEASAEVKKTNSITAFLKRNNAGEPRVESNSAAAKPADGIAKLIDTKTASVANSAEPSAETVAAAQRALVRLGFVLRADGVLGTETKRAIELFEHDHHLPIDTRLSRRLITRLSELSGLAIP